MGPSRRRGGRSRAIVSGTVCASWVEFGYGLRSKCCVRATMRSMVCGTRLVSTGVRCASAPSVDFAVCVPCGRGPLTQL